MYMDVSRKNCLKTVGAVVAINMVTCGIACVYLEEKIGSVEGCI